MATFLQIFSQTVNVVPNTVYTVSFWACSLFPTNPANIGIKINNVAVSTSLQLPSTTCIWQKKSYTWNSLDNTTAQLSVVDLNNLAEGNDVGLDDIFFGMGDECTQVEVEDCNGYLERSINPYLKGLIGNLKPYRSYTYYGDRTEMITLNNTAIRKNGYLSNFTNYWNFNATTNNLIPDATNTKWVWNSEQTKVNSKGQEIETKNALDIYTTTQYGFAKNQTIAVANNSRVNEMFAESFEDSNYGEALNSGNYVNNCSKKHIDFGVGNNNVINTDGYTATAQVFLQFYPTNQIAFYTTMSGNVFVVGNIITITGASDPTQNITFTIASVNGNYITTTSPFSTPYSYTNNAVTLTAVIPKLPFNAHSGKNVMRVLENNFKTKLISLSNPILDQYGLNLKLDTTKFLNQIGSNQSVLLTIPVYQNYQYLTQNQSGGTSLSIDRVHDTVISGFKGYEYELLNSFYINVATCGIKQITVMAGKGNDSYIGGCNIYCNIYYLNGDLIYSGLNANSTSTDLSNSTISFSRYMPVGIYLVKYTLFGNGWQPLGTFQPGIAGDNFNFSMNGPTTAYSSLTTANGCSFTHPIPATDSMLNPIFSPTPNKKMQFSAWVRENCAIPCTQLSYNNSQVQLQFNDGSNTLVNVTPSGAIIDGWQKVEGEFTIPSTATNMQMKFINNGTTPNYWDDIRVHPFNANMKSYVYDPFNLKLSAELDENNYATFYEYDEEGQLVRVKKETSQGIKTIKESRSAKQIGIAEIQE